MFPVIQAEGLAKCYRIARPPSLPKQSLHRALSASFRPYLSRADSFEDFWALQDISFTIMPGETVGIIGANGAGKSTLLKILSRIMKPTKGSALIRGKIGSLLEVGTGFHPELTGHENIYLSGAILGMTRKEINQRFDEIVSFADVAQFLDTPVKRYSSGMYVRLGFAVAACLNPNTLIIDEVLAVGDAAFQRKCFKKLKQLNSAGVTILFVSHNMGAVGESCQRCLLFANGRLIEDGKTREVMQKYLRQTSPSSGRAIEIRRESRSAESPLVLNSVLINQGNPIYHGEALEVIISFQIISEQDMVSFGFAFSTMEGTRIFTCDSDLDLQRLTFSHAGLYSIKAILPELALAPGNYTLDIGARSGDFSALDYRPACASVSVLPGSKTPNLLLHGDPGLRLSCQWGQVKPE